MLLSIKQKKKTPSSLKVGMYDSVVTDIGFHPDYRDKEAVLIKYCLTDENGRTHDYSEIFFNNESNERSQKFFEYLVENDIPLDKYTMFIGCQEKLHLQKTVRGNRTMLTIVERQFISHAEGDGNDV